MDTKKKQRGAVRNSARKEKFIKTILPPRKNISTPDYRTTVT